MIEDFRSTNKWRNDLRRIKNPTSQDNINRMLFDYIGLLERQICELKEITKSENYINWLNRNYPPIITDETEGGE